MASGGKRQGAGRPKGAKGKAPLERQALRDYFDAQAVKQFAPVLAEYYKRARGMKTKSDPKVLIDFLNRTLGKPPESIEFGAGDGEPTTITVIHKQLKDR